MDEPTSELDEELEAELLLEDELLDSDELLEELSDELEDDSLEELLDAYGANRNSIWHPLRALIAAAKQFSRVHYLLLHIRHTLPTYRLGAGAESEFRAATDRVLIFTHHVMTQIAEQLLAEADRLAIHIEAPPGWAENGWEEELPPGQLESDGASRTVDSVRETVAHMATAFLSLAAESDLLSVPDDHASEAIAAPVPEPAMPRPARIFVAEDAICEACE